MLPFRQYVYTSKHIRTRDGLNASLLNKDTFASNTAIYMGTTIAVEWRLVGFCFPAMHEDLTAPTRPLPHRPFTFCMP